MRRFSNRDHAANSRLSPELVSTSRSSARLTKLLRICRRTATFTLTLGARAALFLYRRPEGIFTPAISPAPSTPNLQFRVLTWNILQSESHMLGDPWPARKESFAAVFETNSYDIICLQEALPEQIEFFASILPDHTHYAVGRDDGRSGGEHCPIFFDSAKYELRDSGTFWLSPTPDIPSRSWGENVPRLCSWVELEERASSERFRVYNLHLHLHPFAQPKAAQVMKSRLHGLEVPAIITGDFNAPHGWPALRVLEGAGFTNAETSGAHTYHVLGRGIRCLDHILTDSNWHVAEGGVLKEKGGLAYPSDHFGLWAALALRR